MIQSIAMSFIIIGAKTPPSPGRFYLILMMTAHSLFFHSYQSPGLRLLWLLSHRFYHFLINVILKNEEQHCVPSFGGHLMISVTQYLSPFMKNVDGHLVYAFAVVLSISPRTNLSWFFPAPPPDPPYIAHFARGDCQCLRTPFSF